MSIPVRSTGQQPVVAGSAGWLMAVGVALAVALAGVVALNQDEPAVANPAGAVSNYDAAVVAAAEARSRGEALQAYDAAVVAAAEARSRGEALQAYDAAIVAAAEARSRGEANQAR